MLLPRKSIGINLPDADVVSAVEFVVVLGLDVVVAFVVLGCELLVH